MATQTIEIYELLKQGGLEDSAARRIAQIVLTEEDRRQLATKADLLELKNTLLMWGFVAIFSALGLYSAIMIAIFRSFAR